MKLVVGLGNPGPDYETTRHNVGFCVIEALGLKYNVPLCEKAAKSQIGQGKSSSPSCPVDFILAKPETFMNRSGSAVLALLRTFQIKLSDLILIYDDLDMDCGRVRIRTKGSAGGHRGVASVIDAVGSDHFVRIKIGIGRDKRQDPVDYVLTPFSKSEKPMIQNGIDRCLEALPLLLEGRVTAAMNRYNALCD